MTNADATSSEPGLKEVEIEEILYDVVVYADGDDFQRSSRYYQRCQEGCGSLSCIERRDAYEISEKYKEYLPYYKIKYVPTVVEAIKANQELLKDPGVVRWLTDKYRDEPDIYQATMEELELGDELKAQIEADILAMSSSSDEENEGEEDPEIVAEAREILRTGDPIQAHVNSTRHLHGREKHARPIVLSCYSVYPHECMVHVDTIGSPEASKTHVVIVILGGFPQDKVIVASETSPKALYYLTAKYPEKLKDAQLYIDDVRVDHISTLKTFRNESDITPANLTVSDGTFLNLPVKERPVTLGSSVLPLQDLQNQLGSRTFFVSIEDPDEIETKKIHKAIRRNERLKSLRRKSGDREKRVLREMARILRDEGVRDVLVPFDAEEPEGLSNRGTIQFINFIKVSAFINQYQRPIMTIGDQKFVLATYEDLVMAARIWFDFDETQQYKINPKAIEILKILPSKEPGLTVLKITNIFRERGVKGFGQRTVERYMNELFKADLVLRDGSGGKADPRKFWSAVDLRQEDVTLKPEAVTLEPYLRQLTAKTSCREYLSKYSPDSLKTSIKEFFTINDIISKEDIKEIKVGEEVLIEDPEEIYLSVFPSKRDASQ